MWDARTGSYAVLGSPSVPRQVCVHGTAGRTWSVLADLRVLLVADMLTRIAELHGLQTITVLAADSPPPGGLDEDLRALGIHPPAALARCGSAHVHAAGNAAGSGDGGDGALLGVGPVQDLTQLAAGGNGRDLLALRGRPRWDPNFPLKAQLRTSPRQPLDSNSKEDSLWTADPWPDGPAGSRRNGVFGAAGLWGSRLLSAAPDGADERLCPALLVWSVQEVRGQFRDGWELPCRRRRAGLLDLLASSPRAGR